MDFSSMDPIEDPKKSEILEKWKFSFYPKYRGGFMWQLLNHDCDEKEAYAAYIQQKARAYVVVRDYGDFSLNQMYLSSYLPELDIGRDLIDLHVFPKNMAWSMSFTHEMGRGGMFLGPYFVKSKNYLHLNRVNEKSLDALKRGH